MCEPIGDIWSYIKCRYFLINIFSENTISELVVRATALEVKSTHESITSRQERCVAKAHTTSLIAVCLRQAHKSRSTHRMFGRWLYE